MKHILVITSLLAFIGCAKGISPEEYIAYFADVKNGLVVRKITKDIVYTAQYRTPELQALYEVGQEHVGDAPERIKSLKGFHYFVFTVEPTQLNSVSDSLLDQANTSWMYHGQEYMRLVTEKDSAQAAIFLPIQTGNMERRLTALVGFEKPDTATKNIQLFFYDPWVSKSLIQFPIKKEQIQQIPTLKI